MIFPHFSFILANYSLKSKKTTDAEFAMMRIVIIGPPFKYSISRGVLLNSTKPKKRFFQLQICSQFQNQATIAHGKLCRMLRSILRLLSLDAFDEKVE
jgi:hypothetical protein